MDFVLKVLIMRYDSGSEYEYEVTVSLCAALRGVRGCSDVGLSIEDSLVSL